MTTPGRGAAGTPVPEGRPWTQLGKVKWIQTLVETGMQLKAFCHRASPLYEAIRGRHLEVVDRILKAGSNPDKGCAWENPLHLACREGLADYCKRLLAAGASINELDRYQCSALWWAVKKGHIEVTMVLLENGSDPSILCPDVAETTHLAQRYHGYRTRPLLTAVAAGRTDIARLLIKHGASLNAADSTGRVPLHVASESGDAAAVTLLLAFPQVNPHSQDTAGVTPLHLAARHGHGQVAQLLIDAGCQINVQTITAPYYYGNQSPLHVAVMNNRRDILTMLCKEKATNLNAVDTWGKSPLIHAAEKGFVDCVKTLIQSGCDINIQDVTGDTSLMHACRKGHADIARHLVDARISVDAQGAGERTALHLAAERGFTDICNTLIQSGATLSRRDKYQLTALEYTFCSAKCQSAAMMLLIHGAYIPEGDNKVLQIIQSLVDSGGVRILQVILLLGWQGHKRILQRVTGIIQSAKTDANVISLIAHAAHNPAALRDLCRIAVRQQLMVALGGCSILSAISLLNLSQDLKSYLQFFFKSINDDQLNLVS